MQAYQSAALNSNDAETLTPTSLIQGPARTQSLAPDIFGSCTDPSETGRNPKPNSFPGFKLSQALLVV